MMLSTLRPLTTTQQKLLIINRLSLPPDMLSEIKGNTFHDEKILLHKRKLEIMMKSFEIPVAYRFPERVTEKTTHILHNALNCKRCGNYITVGSKTYERMEKCWRENNGRFDNSWKFNGMWCVCLQDYQDGYDELYVEDWDDSFSGDDGDYY